MNVEPLLDIPERWFAFRAESLRKVVTKIVRKLMVAVVMDRN